MRNVLFFFCFFFAQVSGSLAQNELWRQHPDVWLKRPDVEAAVKWANGKNGGFYSKLRLKDVQLETPVGQKTKIWLRNSDLRAVLDSSLLNLSKSQNQGFNHGAFHFYHKDRLHALGGYGFWRNHSMLIEFFENSGEWGLVQTGEGPKFTGNHGSWFDAKREVVVGLESKVNFPLASNEDVWLLTLENNQWGYLGTLNPEFALYNPSHTCIWKELRDYVVMLQQHKALIVRKSDGLAGETADFIQGDFDDACQLQGKRTAALEQSDENEFKVWSRFAGGGDTLSLVWNVDSVFARLLEAKQMKPFVLAGEGKFPNGKRASYPASENEWPSALNLVLLILASFGLGILLPIGYRRLLGGEVPESSAVESSQVEPTLEGEDPKKGLDEYGQGGDGLVNPLIVELERAEERVLSTEDLNALLGLDGDLSEESRRAKRAQIIRDVNREYQLRYTSNLIERERDGQDRRRTIYVIRPHSDIA